MPTLKEARDRLQVCLTWKAGKFWFKTVDMGKENDGFLHTGLNKICRGESKKKREDLAYELHQHLNGLSHNNRLFMKMYRYLQSVLDDYKKSFNDLEADGW